MTPRDRPIAIAPIAAALLLAAPALPLAGTEAADSRGKPTFYRDVLPIFQNRCQECHRPSAPNLSGMIAPMSLMDYGDTRPWAKSVRRMVMRREMPPWGATHETSAHIANSRSLEPWEIETIVPPPDASGNPRQPFFLGGITSGDKPRVYPEGFGRILHPGSQIVLSVHYSKEAGPGTGIQNQVTMGLKFYAPDQKVKYEIRQTRIGRFFDFEIPPGHGNWKTGAAMEFDQYAR